MIFTEKEDVAVILLPFVFVFTGLKTEIDLLPIRIYGKLLGAIIMVVVGALRKCTGSQRRTKTTDDSLNGIESRRRSASINIKF
jgi:hypothetical protein